MERSWFIEPRFNQTHGSRFHLVGSFTNQFDTSRLFSQLIKHNRDYDRMVLDCSQMTGLDGHGVADIIRAFQEMQKRGVVLEIVRVKSQFRHKFEQVGIGTHVELPISFTEEVTSAARSA